MGAAYSHTCNECGHVVRTSGPWEFYRDKEGKRKPYGHPAPTSREAAEAGIYGLSAELYCPECGKTYDIIIVEFKEPTSDTLRLWSGQCEPKDDFKEEGAVRCPGCGRSDLILGPVEDPHLKCPRCKYGNLIGKMDWIS